MRYGRGKFVHHELYIQYQHLIANHVNYEDIPGAFSERGKPQWQVSSGKTTQLYRYYEARVLWWTKKANELNLPGTGKELDRWTTAARLIHPTGFRPCLICGQERCVGYYYVNSKLINKLQRLGIRDIVAHQSIEEILPKLLEATRADQIVSIFPERRTSLSRYGLTAQAFLETKHVRTPFLSPGFMGNPPYRLDGFHDYCNSCRKQNDPGRSDQNMASYSHDRRAFEYWAEGNWMLADKLSKSAVPGMCTLCGNSTREKLSPDHIGPLSCGFKHTPCFRPICKSCNSSKNRRFTFLDVSDLIAFESQTRESVASWYVRPLWDRAKILVNSDRDARLLSNYMRANQDLFFRCLSKILAANRLSFLCSLLSPHYAFCDYDFIQLDPTSLRYDCVKESMVESKHRQSLFNRSIRIAFDSIEAYFAKPTQRRLPPSLRETSHEIVARIENFLVGQESQTMQRYWSTVVPSGLSQEEREVFLGDLWVKTTQSSIHQSDINLRRLLEKCFTEYAQSAVALLR